MYKEKKLIKSKMFILTVLFVVTMVITVISLNFELVHPATTTMKRALLPTVTMLTDNGTEYNRLHGYTVQIDESLLDETITPLNSDKKLNVVLNTYGSNIVEASYKVRNLSDMSLIENTQVTCSEPSDGKSMATLNIKNLISDNTEYSLEIVLKTDDYDEIHYYTRIITGDNYKLQDKIDFVKNFNSVTFDSSRLNEIAKYLETNSSGSNSNYGKVNINSSLSQVGWGNLNPFVESELVPDIKDINNEVAIICMNYNMGTKNSDDTFDSYSVSEYYRIRQTSSTMYHPRKPWACTSTRSFPSPWPGRTAPRCAWASQTALTPCSSAAICPTSAGAAKPTCWRWAMALPPAAPLAPLPLPPLAKNP